MRILFLAANPEDTDQLRLDEEVREIDNRLRSAEYRVFDLKQQWAVRRSDLSECLLRHQPHIVHFSGHGSHQGEIILQGEDGASQPVSAEALGRLFRVLKDNVRCVVLNACMSLPQAKAIVKEIDCVVGMSKSIGDEAAIKFASGFYRALGYGRSVQTAFDLGCAEIDIASLGEEETPRLLLKRGVNASEIIFVTEASASPSEDKASLQERLTQHRANLQALLKKKSIYAAGEEPLHLLNQIAAEEKAIKEIEQQLRK